jgi:hypothetical protein
MIETATENRGSIFARDKNDSDIIIGDKVVYRKKTYEVVKMEHDVSGDYTETVYLFLKNPDTKKTVVVKDYRVELSD